MSRIIAYTFNAAAHCPYCTCNALACGTLTRRPPLACGTGDEHGVPVDAVDSEGNPVRPVFSTDEHAITNCDRCGDPIGDGPEPACPDADPDCKHCGGTGVRITHHFGNSLEGGSTSDCECTFERDEPTDAERIARSGAHVDTVLDGYCVAALWSSSDCGDPDSDTSLEDLGFAPSDITDETLADMRATVERFVADNWADIAALLDDSYTDSDLGHDLWLSAQGHGAGFFDRVGASHPSRDAFDRLQAAADSVGETHLCLTADGEGVEAF